MSNRIVFQDKSLYRVVFVLKPIIGALIIAVFAYLYFQEGFVIGIWSIAGPLLGLALIIEGLITKSVKQIKLLESESAVEITILSFQGEKVEIMELSKLKVELTTENGKKNETRGRLKMNISKRNKFKYELKSKLFLSNNQSIINTYYELKELASVHKNSKN